MKIQELNENTAQRIEKKKKTWIARGGTNELKKGIIYEGCKPLVGIGFARYKNNKNKKIIKNSQLYTSRGETSEIVKGIIQKDFNPLTGMGLEN